MEGCVKIDKDNPILAASWFSKLTFAWIVKLYRQGSKKQLDITDLYKTLHQDQSDYLGKKLEKNWEDELGKTKLSNRKPSLLRAIIKTFFWDYMLYGFYILILYAVLRSNIPLVLAYLIRLFVIPESDLQLKMYLAGFTLVAMSVLNIFAVHHTNFGTARVGMRVRIACSSLMYRKILKLNQSSQQNTAAGQVINILSNDVLRFDIVTLVLHFLWIMPIQSTLIAFYLWQEVQISSLTGVVSMILLTLPVQGYLGKATSYLRLKVAQRCDHRVKLMSEIINGMQVIKMYAWEKPFEQIVKLARIEEVKALIQTSYIRAIYVSSMVFVERATLYFTIVSYVLLGHTITADKVFSMAQFFNMLQLMMAIYYPMGISFGAESLVAIKRIEDFLMSEEVEESSAKQDDHKGVIIEDVQASWVKGTPNLDNISIKIPPGSLCAVVGPVGAGKSSLLQLILKELNPTVGNVSVGGEVSYSSQNPWLFASSVRNNILFGQHYDKVLYRKVTKVCALLKDFEQFPQGDRTMVGERGVSLSGGQRARINLARAVYRRAEVYLLDDPLSAVDPHVGKHLFNECILRHLRGKTRILVTHQLQFLKMADMIVVVNDGKIEAQGTYEELSKSELDFTKMLAASNEVEEKEKPPSLERQKSNLSTVSFKSDINSYNDEDEESMKQLEESIPITTGTIKNYMKAGGGCCALFSLFAILIAGQAACSAADYWSAYWTQQESLRHSNNTQVILDGSQPDQNAQINNFTDYDYTEPPTYYSYDLESLPFMDHILVNETMVYNVIKSDVAIYVYSVLIIACIVLTLLRSFLFFNIAMKSSKNLHEKMFHALLQAPMRFFDTNPSGRILNRFSKDMGSIDEILPKTLFDAMQVGLVMIGILIMVVVSNVYMLIVIVVLGCVFTKLRAFYLRTATIVKHLEGKAKSPVFTHVTSTINGLVTIRASKTQDILLKQFDDLQDVHTSAWYLILTTMFSFGLWLDAICVIFIACIVFSFIILNHYVDINGAMVGLAISQSLVLTGMLQYGIRQSAEVVNQMISVERVLEYTKLDKEEPFETPLNNKIPHPWPENGLIEMKHLYLKYGPLDAPVLKDLNITIRPGEKVGIVGRTGAGKSSLISALFRLTQIQGSILIDGVDTSIIGLSDLRKKISIIPQEPVLFSASLRYNLDPFYEYKDANLWDALEEVELKDIATSLDYTVTQGGSNFSLGQRQLICLARAVLKNNKILVMDEATANVDPRTDSLIQKTIRKKFKDCTVLTIAHRMNTIMDSDKVLVMVNGNAVEFDHPFTLLQDEGGHFTRMLSETGPVMSQQLRNVAERAYLNL